MAVHLGEENQLCQKNEISRGKGSQLPVTTASPGCMSAALQPTQKGLCGADLEEGTGHRAGDGAPCSVTSVPDSLPETHPLVPGAARPAELCERTFSPGLSIASAHRRYCLSAEKKAGPRLALQDGCWFGWEEADQ